MRELTQSALDRTHPRYPSLGGERITPAWPARITGRAKYTDDYHFPGMLYAKILRPPAHGAKLIKADTAEAKKIDGLQIVEEGDFIAVLHKYPDVAELGLSQIKAQFDRPTTGVNDRTIFDRLMKSTPAPEIASQAGNLKTGENQAATVIEKTYLNSYVSHAPMEPHAAVADFNGKKLTVWASTQTPFRVKDMIADRLGLSADSVRVITPYLGGAFGGKSASQQALEAARLAKSLKKPVQVAWSRAEEFFFDTFRPAAIVKIKAGIDFDFPARFLDAPADREAVDLGHHHVEKEQVEAFLELEGLDYLLLDNMENEQMKKAVELRGSRERPLMEASGAVGRGFAMALGREHLRPDRRADLKIEIATGVDGIG